MLLELQQVVLNASAHLSEHGLSEQQQRVRNFYLVGFYWSTVWFKIRTYAVFTQVVAFFKHCLHFYFQKGKKTAAAETDQEFLEKRWHHEQAMKDKECAMEAQKIALKKAELEQKEKKWARRFDLEEKRMNAEFRLRAQELEERTADREQRAEQARLQAASQQALLNVIQALAEHIKK